MTRSVRQLLLVTLVLSICSACSAGHVGTDTRPQVEANTSEAQTVAVVSKLQSPFRYEKPTKIERPSSGSGLLASDQNWYSDVEHEFSVPVNCVQKFSRIPELGGKTVTGYCFFTLKLESIEWSGGSGYEIHIIDDDDARQVIRPTDVGQEGSVWTGPMIGMNARINVIYSEKSAPDTLTFQISRYTSDIEDPLLSIYEEDRREHTVAVTSDIPALITPAKAVGHIDFSTGREYKSCTGFMISDDLMMTNAHCINSTERCRSAVVTFGYRLNMDFTWARRSQYRCVTLVGPANNALDMAIIRLTGDPGRTEVWGKLTPALSSAGPLFMIQHPERQPQQISREACDIATPSAVGNDPTLQTDFGHTCDTLGGSSGSPLVNAAGAVVGLHHLGFIKPGPAPWNNQNRAVKIKYIIDHLAARCEADTKTCISGWGDG